MCACAISAECAARGGNFEIAKQAELIPQHKVILKKQLYHIRIGLQCYALWHIKNIVLYPLNMLAIIINTHKNNFSVASLSLKSIFVM